jgi:hypothetical protein
MVCITKVLYSGKTLASNGSSVVEVLEMSKMRDRGEEWGNVGGVFSTLATYQQGNYAAYRKILVCQVKNNGS